MCKENAVRIGVIGCGDIAVTQHIPALLQNGDVCLAALCDTDQDCVAALAAEHGIPAYTDAQAMLDACPMDAVIVATPPWVTPQLTMAALAKGLYVLCEKPMALTVAEAEAVAAAERASDAYVQLGFTYRHDPILDQLRRWIAEGRLGHPCMFRLGIYDEIWDPEGNPEHYHRLYTTMEHGCPSVHDGAHNADFLHFLTGSQVRSVAAYGFQSRPEFPCSNYDTSVLHFDNGDMAKLEIGWFFPVLPYGEFEVLGPKGYAVYDRLARFATLKTAEGETRVEDQENWWALCFKIQLEKFVASIRGHAPCTPGCAEGIYSLELTKRIEASIEKNKNA